MAAVPPPELLDSVRPEITQKDRAISKEQQGVKRAVPPQPASAVSKLGTFDEKLAEQKRRQAELLKQQPYTSGDRFFAQLDRDAMEADFDEKGELVVPARPKRSTISDDPSFWGLFMRALTDVAKDKAKDMALDRLDKLIEGLVGRSIPVGTVAGLAKDLLSDRELQQLDKMDPRERHQLAFAPARDLLLLDEAQKIYMAMQKLRPMRADGSGTHPRHLGLVRAHLISAYREYEGVEAGRRRQLSEIDKSLGLSAPYISKPR
jgi:hypothetical protein